MHLVAGFEEAKQSEAKSGARHVMDSAVDAKAVMERGAMGRFHRPQRERLRGARVAPSWIPLSVYKIRRGRSAAG